MNLQEKISTINKPSINSIKTGSASTIGEFWDKFIHPNLFDKEIVEEWWQLLKQYVEDSNCVFAIRTFGNGKDWDKDLRRGFFNITDSDYSFFYTDNFFTAYFCKMAIDGFVPAYDDFKEMMVSRKFPARFGRSCKSERDRAAYAINGKDPGIGLAGYKISHIVDSGNGIWNGSCFLTVSEMCESFFPRGEYDDWTIHDDRHGKFYARDIHVKPEAKELLKAVFLRMTCPLNYVLTPKKELHSTEMYVKGNDIGESEQLQQYAMFKFHEMYGETYTDFLNAISLGKKPSFSKTTENFVINIKYSPSDIKIDTKTTKIKPLESAFLAKQSKKDSSKREKYTEDEIVLCTYAAMYNADDFGGIEKIHKLKDRSKASIEMKIKNIASMLDEENVKRHNYDNISPLTGLTTGKSGRRTNWNIVEKLHPLYQNDFLNTCKKIVKEKSL